MERAGDDETPQREASAAHRLLRQTSAQVAARNVKPTAVVCIDSASSAAMRPTASVTTIAAAKASRAGAVSCGM